jgi:transcriptional regulator with XRE-family HTH domain
MKSVKERVLSLCESRGVRIGTLEKQTEMSNGTISKWTDETVPNGQTLKLIADYFDVSVDYLLGREPSSETEEMLEWLHKNPEMRVLLSSSAKLDKEDLDAVVAIVKRMNKERDIY